MFSRGRIFTGTAQAFADPLKASLRGILQATFDYDLSTLVQDADGSQHFETISVTASALGPINATIASSKSSRFTSSTTTILRGDASLSISQGEVAPNGDPVIVSFLSLVVFGVKQSNAATGSTTITTSG